MLENSKPFGSFSVNDLIKAKTFYQTILGLPVTQNEMGFLELHVEGGQPILIYLKKDHEPAIFTVLNFPVTDIEDTVECLTARGVKFEHYEELHTDLKGISRNGYGHSVAWFKDPSGNILSVIEAD